MLGVCTWCLADSTTFQPQGLLLVQGPCATCWLRAYSNSWLSLARALDPKNKVVFEKKSGDGAWRCQWQRLVHGLSRCTQHDHMSRARVEMKGNTRVKPLFTMIQLACPRQKPDSNWPICQIEALPGILVSIKLFAAWYRSGYGS